MEEYVVASIAQEEKNSRRDKENSGKAEKPQFTIELEGAVIIALSNVIERPGAKVVSLPKFS